MPTVVSLTHRCDCGSTHFRLLGGILPPAVTLDAAGNITGHDGTVVCDECGKAVDRGQ